MKKHLITITATLALAFAAMCAPKRAAVASSGLDYSDYAAFEPTAQDYIQDGLVAMWDGIENAGWGVHDDNTTVWVDLVGGKVGAPYPSGYTSAGDNCMYGGNWKFSNSDKADIKDIFSTGNVTLEVIISFDSVDSFFRGHVINCFNSAIDLSVNANNIAFHSFSTAWRQAESFARYNGGTLGCTIVGDGYNGLSYFNGALFYSEPFSVDPSSMGGDFQLGWENSNWNLRRFHCVRIYNRALSQSEIAYNYFIDRLRFTLK